MCPHDLIRYVLQKSPAVYINVRYNKIQHKSFHMETLRIKVRTIHFFSHPTAVYWSPALCQASLGTGNQQCVQQTQSLPSPETSRSCKSWFASIDPALPQCLRLWVWHTGPLSLGKWPLILGRDNSSASHRLAKIAHETTPSPSSQPNPKTLL